MNKILILTLVLLIKPTIDHKTCKVFEINLNIIKASVEKKPNLKANQINNAIVFMENVTSIKSESDGNYFGRFNPTMKDYNNWKEWFKNNYGRLYWNKEENKVKVKQLDSN